MAMAYLLLTVVGACPAPSSFNDLWGCPTEQLQEELLQDSRFGSQSSWETYLKAEGLASFDFTGSALNLRPFQDARQRHGEMR